MEMLFFWDQQIFFFINHLPHTLISDFIAQTFSGFGNGIILWIFASFFLFFREEKKDHKFVIPVVAIVVVSWFISELALKNIFLRVRPFILPGSILVGNVPDGFSFPSTHTVLAFAFAVILSSKKPKWRYGWLMIAGIVGLSRIYLGHHYPLDVAAGIVLGCFIGNSILWVYKEYVQKKRTSRKCKKKSL